METTKKTLILILVGISFMVSASASNMRTLMTLTGNWQFNLGDNKEWAKPQFDDSKWDNIIVPSSWENQGYVGYDGFAWYRKKFTLPEGTSRQDLFVQINNIDDVDKIYINGQAVGQTGKFPPHYSSGWGNERIYVIPNSLINFFGENTIAVRVYDDGGDGGLVNAPVRLAYNSAEELLKYKFDGDWKFTVKDNSDFGDPDFKDSDWKTIKVPQSWQSQGYWGYNGHAWYRYQFELDPGMNLDNMYMILGKIDDYDEVYLNGKIIGKNWDKSLFGDNIFSDFTSYRILRGYKIPKHLCKTGKNIIAIRVYDHGGVGGIYEGPIGVAEKDAWEDMHEKNNYEIRDNNFSIFKNF